MIYDPLCIAIILGVWGTVVALDLYSAQVLCGVVPLISGFFIGILLGDPITGTYVGAYLQLMALGLVPIGGKVPLDFEIITAIIVVSIIVGGVDPYLIPVFILSLIPLGVLMKYLEVYARSFNALWIKKAEESIDKGKLDDISKWHFLGLLPLAGVRGFLHVIGAYIMLRWGINALRDLVREAPTWFFGGLKVVGELLPLLGFSILLTYMSYEKKYHILLASFTLSALLTVSDSLIALAVLIVILVRVAWLWAKGEFEIGSLIYNDQELGKLGKKILRAVTFRSGFLLQCSWNYERMQALGYLFSILPALKRIYRDNELLKRAAKIHLEFFNTNPFLAPILVGVNVAIEERNLGNFELIRSLRRGLMGAFMGIGDGLVIFSVGGILLVMGSVLSLQSMVNPLYAYVPLIVILIFDSVFIPFKLKGSELGYKGGLKIIDFLAKEKIKKLKDAFEQLSLLTMGALIPVISHLRVSSLSHMAMEIKFISTIISINKFISGVISLLALLLMKKLYGWYGILFSLLMIFLIGFLLGALGILTTPI